MTKLEIPVKPLIKKYFEGQLSDDLIIEKRHWLARHICSVVSYHPLDKLDLPITYSEKDLSEMEMLTLQVTFPLKVRNLTNHHYVLLANVLESIFELAVINFCRGRFAFSLNYNAAINDFFERNDLDSVEYDKDLYRRFINKKYGSQIKSENAAVLRKRDREVGLSSDKELLS
jgi:hypothetical protein